MGFPWETYQEGLHHERGSVWHLERNVRPEAFRKECGAPDSPALLPGQKVLAWMDGWMGG